MSTVAPWFLHRKPPNRWTNHGRTMDEPWTNHGGTMEEPWRNHGQTLYQTPIFLFLHFKDLYLPLPTFYSKK
jgi:hypothetical protein